MNTPEGVIAKVAVNAVTEVFKLTLNSFGKTHQWFKKLNKKHDFFDKEAKQYTKRIEERYNIMRIFGMNQPVLLRSIYTRVNILKKITAQQHTTVGLAPIFSHPRSAIAGVCLPIRQQKECRIRQKSPIYYAYGRNSTSENVII